MLLEDYIRHINRTVILFDLNGTLVHNNRSLGSGNLSADYAAGDPNALRQAYAAGDLPKGYYLTEPEEVIWIDGALEAVVELSQLFECMVITNQEWIGCGIPTPDLALAHWNSLRCHLTEQVLMAGGKLNIWYYCPHAPDAQCWCHKRRENPGLGLFYSAAQDQKFYLPNAWMVGDNPSDIIAGNAAGCKTCFIPLPQVETKDREAPADITAHNIAHAVELIRGWEGV